MNRLWYDKPARQWEEALPLGNGRLGAMVSGGTDQEIIQTNEESMWYGGKVDRNNPDLKEHLPEIRRLLSEGRIREAESLLAIAATGCPESMHPYQTLGNIVLDYHCNGEVTQYTRSLDLERAAVNVDFSMDDILYKREYFISRPVGCMVMRLTASQPGRLSLTARLERGRFYDGAGKWKEDGILLFGNLGRGGVEYAVMLRARTKGGELRLTGETLQIQGADEILLYYTADTSYHLTPEREEAYAGEHLYQQALQSRIRECLDARTERCMGMDYESLWEEHLEDYQSLFGRVELQLEDTGILAAGTLSGDGLPGHGGARDMLPTDERLAQPGGDIGLMKQLFDFGRYLLICSSREGDLPATLQGIWNKDFTPPWDSKYTININLQMNYWPAEICNLSECHTVLLPLLQKMRQNGRKTARQMYGCRGFVAHHNTDVHGDTAPQDRYIPATYWVMGAAWLCTHLWTHYQYTNDRAFLREAFPVMAEAALFFVDFLVEKDGFLVTSPSVSPENTYILPTGERGSCCVGPAMDSQILRHLFTGCLSAAAELGGETAACEVEGIEDMESFLAQLAEIMERLVPVRVGSRGTILEWMEEYEEADPGHRHISHLYGLYPSDEITVDGTPELAAAARRTLERRLANGGGHTGWSRAWIMNHYAKLWDGESLYANLEKMLENSTYPNLFDRHPPFQIDGNFGAASAIAQALVQSSPERVVLLPALPKAWGCGSVRGLRIIGNAEIDMAWKDGKLLACTIRAFSDYRFRIRYGDMVLPVSLKAGEVFEAGEQLRRDVF